jgi:copper(I)-binding protein
MKNQTGILLTLVIILLLSASCQKDDVRELNSEKSFILSNIWMRPGVENRNSAAFMTITNNTGIDDTLYSVGSDLAKVTELHETFTADDDMTGMRHVEMLIIPSEATVQLEPGGYHIMLIGLNQSMKKDSAGKLTLHFKIAGRIEVEGITR